MRSLISFPIIFLILIIQTSILSSINLLSGTADLMLVTLAALALQEQFTEVWHWAILGGLLIGLVSGILWFVPLIAYILVVGLARIMQQRIWQAPNLGMFAVTFIGTWIIQLLSFIALQFTGSTMSFNDALGAIILPTLLLNLLLAIPVRALMVDLSNWLYPIEDSV